MNETLQAMMEQVMELGVGYVPSVVGALGVLVLGWIVALALRAMVVGALRRTTLDNRLAQWVTGGREVSVERYVGTIVFWVVMLFVVMAVFQALSLTTLTQPLNVLLSDLSRFAPRLGGAAILLLVAWAVATVLRNVVSGLLRRMDLDRRLSDTQGEPAAVSVSGSIGEAIYWLVFLFFLPAVLGALALEGLLAPVQSLVDELLGFLPNLFGAGITLAVGWFVAGLVRRITTSLTAAAGVDQLSDRVGLGKVLGTMTLSALLGLVVYVFVLIPVLIAALNGLQLAAVTAPASDMLASILAAIPLLFGATLVIFVAYVVGRVVSNLAQTVLAGAGFDNVLVGLGLARARFDGRSPSELAATLILVTVMLFASLEAASLLGFGALSVLISDFLVLGGHVVFGLVILGIGLFLANLAGGTITASGVRQANWLALAARLSIVVLAGAVALRQMGLANEIITLAFGLLIGALAVAAALAFGLGARDAAGRVVDRWMEEWNEGESGRGV